MKKGTKISLIILISFAVLLFCGLALLITHLILNGQLLNSDLSETNSSQVESVISMDAVESKPKVESKAETVSKPVIENPVSSETVIVPSVESMESEIDETQTVEFITQQNLFKMLYSNAETQYKMGLTNKIISAKQDLDEVQQALSSCASQKMMELRKLERKYAEMGLINSGAYNSAKISLENQYNGMINQYTAKATSLRNEISSLEKEQQNPDVLSILALVAYNNGMTADEVAEKYEKYMQ